MRVVVRIIQWDISLALLQMEEVTGPTGSRIVENSEEGWTWEYCKQGTSCISIVAPKSPVSYTQVMQQDTAVAKYQHQRRALEAGPAPSGGNPQLQHTPFAMG